MVIVKCPNVKPDGTTGLQLNRSRLLVLSTTTTYKQSVRRIQSGILNVKVRGACNDRNCRALKC